MGLTITPLDAPLGAEITGIDIAAGIADDDFKEYPPSVLRSSSPGVPRPDDDDADSPSRL